MRARTLEAIFIALFVAVGARQSGAQANDSTLIAITKRASVRSLDSTFASTPLAEWLPTLRPLPASRVQWGVNDCGEGGDGRRAPFCVEAKLELARDTTAYIYLILATPDRRAGAPAIAMLFAIVGDSTRHFKTLAEWAAFVRPRRP